MDKQFLAIKEVYLYMGAWWEPKIKVRMIQASPPDKELPPLVLAFDKSKEGIRQAFRFLSHWGFVLDRKGVGWPIGHYFHFLPTRLFPIQVADEEN